MLTIVALQKKGVRGWWLMRWIINPVANGSSLRPEKVKGCCFFVVVVGFFVGGGVFFVVVVF